MSRRISGREAAPPSAQPLAEPAAPEPKDGYTDRLLKYIPAEVVTLYGATSKGVASFAPWGPKWPLGFSLFAFVFCLGAAAAVTWTQTRKPDKPTAIDQIAISTLAFAVWALALGVPELETQTRLLSHEVWQFVLPFFTFAVALHAPRQ